MNRLCNTDAHIKTSVPFRCNIQFIMHKIHDPILCVCRQKNLHLQNVFQFMLFAKILKLFFSLVEAKGENKQQYKSFADLFGSID